MKIIYSKAIKFFFRLLAIMTMIQIFLPVFSYNVPYPFSSYLFYSFCWIFGVLIFQHKVYLSIPLRYIYILFIVFLIGIPIFWQDVIVSYHFNQSISYSWLRSEMASISIAILIYSYFLKSKDYKGFAIVVLCALICIGITSVTSIYGLKYNPMAARELAGGLTRLSGDYEAEYYLSKGIATFSFFTGLSFLFPVLVYQFKKKIKTNKQVGLIISLLIIVSLYAIVQAMYTTALVFAFAFTLLSISKFTNMKRINIFFLIMLVLILSFPATISDLIYTSSTLFSGTHTEMKLKDLAQTIKNPVLSRDVVTTHTGYKYGSIPILIKDFFQNPLIGSAKVNMGHNFWLNRLSLFGLLGTIPWLLLVKYQIQNNLKIVSQSYRPYYILSMTAFVTMGIINNLAGPQLFCIVFLLIPGVYFIKYLPGAVNIQNLSGSLSTSK